jgi:two-component system OmpR family response regulator/two-component system response regulator CpxR
LAHAFLRKILRDMTNEQTIDLPRVLLVDDDEELLVLLSDYLTQEGFEVNSEHDGQAGVDSALSGNHDIVVLDVMMPGLNGIQALSAIRTKSKLPVLMLTAKGDDTDRILGLELGADDYVPKPCTPRELTARIRAILKRVGSNNVSQHESKNHPISAGTIKIWPATRRIEENGVPLELTSSEFNLLEILVRNAGSPVTKEELSIGALGRPFGRYERSIDVHISSIRRKLSSLPDGRSRIHTVVRKGYQFIVE